MIHYTLRQVSVKFHYFHETFFQINLSLEMITWRLQFYILTTHFLFLSYIKAPSFGNLNNPLFWEIYLSLIVLFV